MQISLIQPKDFTYFENNKLQVLCQPMCCFFVPITLNFNRFKTSLSAVIIFTVIQTISFISQEVQNEYQADRI